MDMYSTVGASSYLFRRKMKIADIEMIINSEIGWCYENPKGVNKEYRDGFIAGLKQAKLLIVEFDKKFKERK